jgi:hypothetical protein
MEAAGSRGTKMSNLRNSQLLQQVGRHPLKAALARCFDISETFAGDVEFLSLDKNLSSEGRENARQSKLRAAIRDLRDARAPIHELETKLAAKRKAVAMPKFDPADTIGFLRRMELRTALRSMENSGQRELLLQDPAFADAMLEQPPVLSGLQPQQIGEDKSKGNQDFLLVEAAKKQRLESLFAPQLAEIAELEGTVAEANMIADLARVDLQSSSGMEPRVFAEFVKPVEAKQNAVWLKRDTDLKGNAIVRVFDPANHTAFPIATADQVRDGVFFKDFEEYQASRAA